MPITTGGFEDLVQLTQDTLYYVGADLEIGNTSVGSSASIGFNNTAGDLQVVGVATGNQTVYLPTSGNGTLALAVTLSNSNNISFGLSQSTITATYNFNFSAGTTSANLNALTFSNSNNISFGLSGSTVTAMMNGPNEVSAGTQSMTSGTLVFANSNGVTFGMSGSSQITASIATSLTNINVSAGTTSNNLSAVTFSNANGISFGLNGSILTGSIATSLSVVNFSAGTTSGNLGSVVFSNSNGVSFGLNGSTITASHVMNVSAGTTSNNLNSITFSNSNGISFGLNGSILTGSVATSLTNINVSAGTTSNNLSAVTFSNSNNVSFGLNGSTVTASANLTGDWFDNVVVIQPDGNASGAMGTVSNLTGSVSSLFVAPLHGLGHYFPFDISASTFFFPDLSVSGSTATMSVAFTSAFFVGIYTLNASSLSLLNSGSCSFGFAAAATNNSTGFAGGFRYVSWGSANWSSNPVFRYGSRYWMGWFWSSAGALNQTASIAGNFMFSTGQRSGLFGASNLTATSNGAAPFYGIYTAQTAALPGSIGSNQLQKTGSMAGFVPHFIMAANASLTVF